MKHNQTQQGFTLVELAIVMTIIGLLIGGILQGQELMQNARATATIAQVRGYEGATTTFRDRYDAMPGDMLNAATRIPNCNANCDPVTNSAGNGFVGAANYTNNWNTQTTNTLPAPPNNQRDETTLYWSHLLFSDLITGVQGAINGERSAWGITHPASKIGGGFVVGFGQAGNTTPGQPAGNGPAGTILVMVTAPTTGTVGTMTAAGTQPLNPNRAAQIDRRMDDGRPDTGLVRAYGLAASCFGTGPNGETIYVESEESRDCGLVFRIQN